MSEKPILFNTQMVRQIVAGNKTQTRRPILPRYSGERSGFRVNTQVATGVREVEYIDDEERGLEEYIKPPYRTGDILYVRETWNYGFIDSNYRECAPSDVWFEEDDWKNKGQKRFYPRRWFYKADPEDEEDMRLLYGRWRPSIHMPKEAARIFLKVTAVRVERLQEISSEDIDAEGCKEWAYSATTGELLPSEPTWFRIAWDGAYSGKGYGWDENPWVWVFEFEVIRE